MKHLIEGLMVLFIILSGCGSPDTLNPSQESTKFPITLIGNRGENVTILAPPERIVSLAPSNTEILFALGLGEKVVGVTEYCDYPEEATEKEKIGGFKTVDIEKVVSLNPDLVLATGGVQTDAVQKLRELGLIVVVVDARDIDGILENLRLVGRITDRNKEAESLIENMVKKIDAIKKERAGKREKPSVIYIIWGDPLMVAGPDTFASDLIELAGGENAFSDAALQYPAVSMESVIERDPQAIIASDHIGIDLKGLKNATEWREVSAVKNNNLYTIDADIVNRPGPRIVDALELFAAWIGA